MSRSNMRCFGVLAAGAALAMPAWAQGKQSRGVLNPTSPPAEMRVPAIAMASAEPQTTGTRPASERERVRDRKDNGSMRQEGQRDMRRDEPGHTRPERHTEMDSHDAAHIDRHGPMTAADKDWGIQEFGYKEISDFFNVREANANVECGEWEFEASSGWVTRSDGRDDDFATWATLKYGITNDVFAQIEILPVNIGDGSHQGNGDLALQLFWQYMHENGDDWRPAGAIWGEMRVPSGDHSSGVDAALHANFTKTLGNGFRAHMEGWIETANGARGGDDYNRRNFQWGVGPGFDYTCDNKNIWVLNYLNRSSQLYGNHNQNILEVGYVREITPTQHLKAAIDVGLDGARETPNFAAKIQYSWDWK